jgi:trigger factor
VADLAGRDVMFETSIKKVLEKALPELDDEFAKKAGAGEDVKTLSALKADIKRELTAQKEHEAREKQKDDLVQKLVEVSDVPAPQVLIDDQTHSIEQDTQQNLLYQNMTLDNYLRTQNFNVRDEWIKKEVTPAATRRVKAGLALAELSKELKINVSDKELEEFTKNYKTQYANDPEMVKRFDEPEVQRDLRNRLATEKTVEKLVEINK